MTTAKGCCLCGQLQFQASLSPMWVGHCHCTLCQKNSGAAFVTWAGFHESDVVITDSNNILRWFSATETALRGFCSVCGSTVFFKSARWPSELHITVVNFEPTLENPPQVNVYWDSHQAWIEHMPALPKESL